MKGTKEDDKVMGPLFPRLHVNDTDKGGPRAPPRNKMALYEQLSIPSQRFNSGSSALPFPPHNSGNLLPSNSSSQVCGHQRNMFSPFYMTSQVPVHSAERANSKTSDGMNHNATRTEFERRSIKQASSGNLFGTGLAAECSSLRQHNPNVKDSSGKKLDDVDDFVVPTFDQSGTLAFSKHDAHMTGAGKPQNSSSAAVNSSNQCPKLNEKSLEQADVADINSRNFNRIRTEKNCKETSAIEEHKETKEKPASNKTAERSNRSKYSLTRDGTSNLLLTEKSVNGNPVSCRENGDLTGAQTLNDIFFSEYGEALKVRNELYSKASSGKGHRTSYLSGNCHQEDNGKENGSLDVEDAEKIDETSEPSMVDSVSSLALSPDDVVGVIGPKHFWKARRAIINQQRVFAIQVFELHRLIKVQKLIAASPHLLLEGNLYLSKSPAKAPNKALPPQCDTNTQPEEFRWKDFQKPIQNIEQPAEDFAGVPALPACGDGSKGGPQGQVPKAVSNSGVASPVPMAPDDKPSPWCFPPLANQWLVPVMSPSEGLVYKPYTGPCPPTGGFMAPLYGSCTPLGVPHVAGDFMNPVCGVPASHRPPNVGVLPGPPTMAPHYFPTPYDGLRVLNPIMSTSAVEQVSNLASSQPNGQTVQHSRSSCNMSDPRNKAFSGRLGKFQVSKNSEVQGSTASSPSEKAQPEGRDAMLVFPTAPAAKSLNCPSQSSGRDSQARVIKVVPHNARSASESAARIFRSIQEERQQHDP